MRIGIISKREGHVVEGDKTKKDASRKRKRMEGSVRRGKTPKEGSKPRLRKGDEERREDFEGGKEMSTEGRRRRKREESL